MRVGILGGTFNPPHIGHLRLAEEVHCFHGLDRVVFIPSFIPPHKEMPGVAAANDRLEMTRRACERNPVFHVSDIEVAFQKPSYTVNTLEFFTRNKDWEIYFILGTDSLREISTWKDYQRLFSLANFIVVNRPGIMFQEAWKEMPDVLREQFKAGEHCMTHASATRVIHSKITGLDISATRIRNWVKSGRSIRYLVTESVRSYILEKELYLA